MTTTLPSFNAWHPAGSVASRVIIPCDMAGSVRTPGAGIVSSMAAARALADRIGTAHAVHVPINRRTRATRIVGTGRKNS